MGALADADGTLVAGGTVPAVCEGETVMARDWAVTRDWCLVLGLLGLGVLLGEIAGDLAVLVQCYVRGTCY